MIVEPIIFPNDAQKWDLVNKFFALRKEVFVEKMDWPLFCEGDKEFEQYDTLDAVYIIAHENGEVYGGTRLVKTTTAITGYGAEPYTYMLRDAYKNRLPGLPSDIVDEEPPVDEKIWELTRLASDPKVQVGRDVLNGANDYLHSIGASKCLVLARPPLFRMARSMNFQPKALGKIRGNDNGKFIAFESRVIERGVSTEVRYG